MNPQNMGSGGMDPRNMSPGGMDPRIMGLGSPGIDPRSMHHGGMGPGGMRSGIGPSGQELGPGGVNMGPGGPRMSRSPGMMMGSRPGGMVGHDGMGPNGPLMGGHSGHGPMGPSDQTEMPNGPMGPFGHHSIMGPVYGPNGQIYSLSNSGNMMNGPMGPPIGMSGPMHSPMPQSSTPSGMTTVTGSRSNSPHGSTHGSRSGTPTGPLSGGPHSTGAPPNHSMGGPNGPNSVGPPMGHNGMGMNVPVGPSSLPNMMRPIPSPLSMMSNEKVYPPGQPMVFNLQNPSAPPIYPCGVCRREVNDNDQAILCESGCNFWFHRICTGLAENAFHFLTQEIYAEWVCDKCFTTKDVPLVKFKP